jgi:hypothetical protein
MTRETQIRCYEEAAELGDRFPELSDFDVLQHVSEVCKLSAPIEPQWAVARCVLMAYSCGASTMTVKQATQEGIACAMVWGIIE